MGELMLNAMNSLFDWYTIAIILLFNTKEEMQIIFTPDKLLKHEILEPTARNKYSHTSLAIFSLRVKLLST